MSFVDAVQRTPELTGCLKAGLQALGSNRRKIRVDATRTLTGSVDIDACLIRRYPNAPRWDYVFGYKDRVYYVEVHQGRTGEMENIIAKLDWLRQWRERSAQSLADLKHQSTYHWISTGKIDSAFGKNSRYRRILRQKSIFGPDPILNVDAVL